MSEHSEANTENSFFSSFEKHIPKFPEWLDENHTDFPKYFSVAVLDEKGNVIRWWERLPEHMKLHPPL